MATTIKRNDLLITIDPGYDGIKVCVGGILFTVPNAILEYDEGQRTKQLKNADFDKTGYLAESGLLEGKEHLAGYFARKEMMEEEARLYQLERGGQDESYERFGSASFKYFMSMVIGKALVMYAKASDENKWKTTLSIKKTGESKDGREIYKVEGLKGTLLFLGIALPHAAIGKAAEVRENLAGQKHFLLEVDNDIYDIDFNINADAIVCQSQVMVAYAGAATDDEGTWQKDSNAVKRLPAIMIDGGYKTVGIFKLTETMSIINPESNTEFSMINVHKNVSAILKEKYGRDIPAFEIPNYLDSSRKGTIRVINQKTGKQENLDLKPIITAEIEGLCARFIEYLKEKYEDLLDINQIIVTGGTGRAYFEGLQKYVNDGFDEGLIDLNLTEYEFFGAKINPIYAIVAGMYKVTKGEINRQIKIAEKTLADES